MESSGRDNLGRFVPGRTVSLEEKKRKLEGMRRHFEEFIPSARLREQNPYIFNAWRSMLYTKKGKAVGCSTPEWRVFENFYTDVSPTYKEGYRFYRIDTTLPFSKENFVWATPEQASNLLAKNTIIIHYNGEDLTLHEAAVKYNVNYNGLKTRYTNGKNYTVEEILFGKKVNRWSKVPTDAEINTRQERCKASKMVATYRTKDKKHGTSVCDFDTDWMIENIMHKPCVYCGDTHRVGCDRIDNQKGHTKDNVVPCCYECNIARGNNFTYDEMMRLGQTIRKIKADRDHCQRYNGLYISRKE